MRKQPDAETLAMKQRARVIQEALKNRDTNAFTQKYIIQFISEWESVTERILTA